MLSKERVSHSPRQAMIVNVYDDMVVFERHEVNQGGKLGPRRYDDRHPGVGAPCREEAHRRRPPVLLMPRLQAVEAVFRAIMKLRSFIL